MNRQTEHIVPNRSSIIPSGMKAESYDDEYKEGNCQRQSGTTSPIVALHNRHVDSPVNFITRPSHNFDKLSIHAGRSRGVQTKLAINSPGDKYEQEADFISEKIIRMENSGSLQPQEPPGDVISGKIQKCEIKQEAEVKNELNGKMILSRKRAQCEKDDERLIQRKESGKGTPTVSDGVKQTIQSSGQPLDAISRNFMEPRFGFDFSTVRIHYDVSAQQSANAINALAYTHQNNIVFGAGQYQPQTIAGKKLLAHELTHVVQQHQGEIKYGGIAMGRNQVNRFESPQPLGNFVSVDANTTGSIQRQVMDKAKLDAYIAEVKKKSPTERQRIFKELKERLKKPDSYPEREFDQAVFNAIDGPVLSFIEDEKGNQGNQYARRTPEGWMVNGVGFMKAHEGGTTWEAIKRFGECEKQEAEQSRLKKIEQDGGDVAFQIYKTWSDKWNAQLRTATQREARLRSALKSDLGESDFMDKWVRFQNGVEYNDETWLNALGVDYRTAHFEVAQAEHRVLADPVWVLESVRASVSQGKWPKDVDFERFVESAWAQTRFRQTIGMAVMGLAASKLYKPPSKPPTPPAATAKPPAVQPTKPSPPPAKPPIAALPKPAAPVKPAVAQGPKPSAKPVKPAADEIPKPPVKVTKPPSPVAPDTATVSLTAKVTDGPGSAYGREAASRLATQGKTGPAVMKPMVQELNAKPNMSQVEKANALEASCNAQGSTFGAGPTVKMPNGDMVVTSRAPMQNAPVIIVRPDGSIVFGKADLAIENVTSWQVSNVRANP